MSFPRYDEYKDSGVEWLGEIPAHWAVVSLKHLSNRISSGKTPLGGSETYVNEGVLFLRSQNVYDEGLQLDDVAYITPDVDDSMASSRVKAGDILLNITGASIGRSCLIPPGLPPANVNQHVCAIRLCDGDLGAFVAWFMKAAPAKAQIDFAQNGAAREGLNFAQIGQMKVALPPKESAESVAAFLDRETAKIDDLVAEQQNLIALLKEKRQALISHAVTKGLNPNAPMKESGVEWLGEVPAHWKVMPLKYLTTSMKAGPFGSALTKDMYVSSGYRVYGQEQVIPGDFCIGDYYITPEDFSALEQYAVSSEDVLISCVGTFGKIAIVPPTAEPGIINPRLIRLRVGRSVSPRYIVELMRSGIVFEQFTALSRGGTMDVINIGTLSNIVVPIPPREEQPAIENFVTSESSKIDDLVAEAVSTINLLQERRTALISAAVTGKIDVRNAVAQKEEAAA